MSNTPQWAPRLLLEARTAACGTPTSYTECLPGLFNTSADAMAAAEAASRKRPEAIGISAKRMEASHGV